MIVKTADFIASYSYDFFTYTQIKILHEHLYIVHLCLIIVILCPIYNCKDN